VSALARHARARSVLSRGGARVAKLERRAVPHRVLLRALPLAIVRRFDPHAAGELEATFELRIRDPAGAEPDRFELSVTGGQCSVRPSAAHTAGAVVLVGGDDLIRLISGAVSWPQLLSSGRLELSGDPFLVLRFPTLFRLPASGRSDCV
jgi:hypothetical protein